MQKITVLITNNRVFTFHNAGFSTLDSTDFLGFGCKKNEQKETKSAFLDALASHVVMLSVSK